MAVENPFNRGMVGSIPYTAIFKPEYIYITESDDAGRQNAEKHNLFIDVIRLNLRKNGTNKSIDNTLALYLGLLNAAWPQTFLKAAVAATETITSNIFKQDQAPDQIYATKQLIENAIKNAEYYKAAIALLKDVEPEAATEGSSVREVGQYSLRQINAVIGFDKYKEIIGSKETKEKVAATIGKMLAPAQRVVVAPPAGELSALGRAPLAPVAIVPGDRSQPLPAPGAPVAQQLPPPPGAPVVEQQQQEDAGEKMQGFFSLFGKKDEDIIKYLEAEIIKLQGTPNEKGALSDEKYIEALKTQLSDLKHTTTNDEFQGALDKLKATWGKSATATSEALTRLLEQQFLFRILHYKALNQDKEAGKPYILAFRDAVNALVAKENAPAGDHAVAVKIAKLNGILPGTLAETTLASLLSNLGLDGVIKYSGGAGGEYHWKYYDLLVASLATPANAVQYEDIGNKLLEATPASGAPVEASQADFKKALKRLLKTLVDRLARINSKELKPLAAAVGDAADNITQDSKGALKAMFLKQIIDLILKISEKIKESNRVPEEIPAIVNNLLAQLKELNKKGSNSKEILDILAKNGNGTILSILTQLLEISAAKEAERTAAQVEEQIKTKLLEDFTSSKDARIAAVEAYKEAKELLASAENRKNNSFGSYREYIDSGTVNEETLRQIKLEYTYAKVTIQSSLRRLRAAKENALGLLGAANNDITRDLLSTEGQEAGELSEVYAELLAELNATAAARDAALAEELNRLPQGALPTPEEVELEELLAAAEAPAVEEAAAEAPAEEEAAAAEEAPAEAEPEGEAPAVAAEPVEEAPAQPEAEAPAVAAEPVEEAPAQPEAEAPVEGEAAVVPAPEGEAPAAEGEALAEAPEAAEPEGEAPAPAEGEATEAAAGPSAAPAEEGSSPPALQPLRTSAPPKGFTLAQINEASISPVYEEDTISSEISKHLSKIASEQTARTLGDRQDMKIQTALKAFTDKISKAVTTKKSNRQFYNDLGEILTAISEINSNILKRVIILQFIKANIKESLIPRGENAYYSLSTEIGWTQFNDDVTKNNNQDPTNLLSIIQKQIMKEIAKKPDLNAFLNAFSIAIQYKGDNSKNLDAQIIEIFGINTLSYLIANQRLEWIDLFGSLDENGRPSYISKLSSITLPTNRESIKKAIEKYFKNGYNLNTITNLFGSSSVPSLPPVRVQTERGATPIGKMGDINQGASTSARPPTPLFTSKRSGVTGAQALKINAPGYVPNSSKYKLGGGMEDQEELEKFTRVLLKGGMVSPASSAPVAITPAQLKEFATKLKEQQKGIREVREILNNLREKYETYRKSVKDDKEFASEQILTADEKTDFKGFIEKTSDVVAFKAVNVAIKERNEANTAVSTADTDNAGKLMKLTIEAEVDTFLRKLYSAPSAEPNKITTLVAAIKDVINKKAAFPKYQNILAILKKLNKEIGKNDETFVDEQFNKATAKFEDIQKGNNYSEQEIIGISDFLKSNITDIKKSNTELSNKATAKIQEIVKSVLETVKPFELREFFKMNNPYLLALMEGTEDTTLIKALSAGKTAVKFPTDKKADFENVDTSGSVTNVAKIADWKLIKGFIPLLNDIKRLFEKDANYYNNAFQQQAVGLEALAKQKRADEEARLRAEAEGRERERGRRGGGAMMEGGEESADRKLLDEYLNTTFISPVSEYKYLSIFDYLDAISGILNSYVKRMDTISDPAASAALSGDKSIFNLIFEKYTKAKETSATDPATSEYEATNALVGDLETNNLIPRDVLKVTMRDKVVFIFATLFMRLICMSILEYLIEKDVLRTLLISSAAYLGLFTLFFIGFVVLINLDMYRLRIVFNYVNFHGSSANIYMYLILLWSFGLIVYFIMRSINRGVTIKTTNDESRARLMYRMQVLSLIVWLFLVLMVAII